MFKNISLHNSFLPSEELSGAKSWISFDWLKFNVFDNFFYSLLLWIVVGIILVIIIFQIIKSIIKFGVKIIIYPIKKLFQLLWPLFKWMLIIFAIAFTIAIFSDLFWNWGMINYLQAINWKWW